MTLRTTFAGFGGQGVLFMGYLLALAAMREGKNVTYVPSYGAEMRGGTANCTVVVSDQEIASPVASSPDVAVVMNNPSLIKFATQVKSGGYLMVNGSLVHSEAGRNDLKQVNLPVSDLAHEVGEDRAANMVMLGAFAQATNAVRLQSLKDSLGETKLANKPGVVEINIKAIEVGAENAKRVLDKEQAA